MIRTLIIEKFSKISGIVKTVALLNVYDYYTNRSFVYLKFILDALTLNVS